MRPVCIRNKRYARTCTAVAHKRSSVQLQRRKRNSCRSFVLRYKFGCVCCGDCPCRYRVYRQGSDRGRKIAGSRRRSDNVAYRASAGYKEHTSRTRKRIYRTGKGNLDSRLHCGNGYYQSGTVCRLKDI